MAQGYSIDIKGMKELQDKLANMPKQLQKEVSGVVEDGAKVFVRNAKRDAPVDFGVLRNEITYFPLGNLKFEIVSGARYSPYLEFGTITKVRVPVELSSYAIQFKGRGIKKNGGLYPHPFFFKQIPLVKTQIEKDIKQITDSIKL